MVYTFGGYSFGTDESIGAYLSSNQVGFVDMVVSYNLLLSSYKKPEKIDEVIRIAQRQAYPRIGMILSSAKDNDNSFLFADETNTYQSIYIKVIEVMTSPDSPFSEGLAGVAARYTAAILIGYININTDIRNVDMAKFLEEEATKDLERIIELIRISDNAGLRKTRLSLTNEGGDGRSFYVALDIDKTSLPASYFDVGLANEVVYIEDKYPDSNVRTITSLSIPDSHFAFGHLFYSSMEVQSSSIPYSVQETFLINDGDDHLNVIIRLAEVINQTTLGLQAGDLVKTNILAAPNKGDYKVTSVLIPKNKLYPYENNAFDRKLAEFGLSQQIGEVNFRTRRQDPVVSYELIILTFYTISAADVAQFELGDDVTWSYVGNWSAGTYDRGDIVTYNNYRYACTVNNTTVNPTDFDNWQLLLPTKLSLLPILDKATNGIEGLVYGVKSNYLDLDVQGPSSLTLVVDENKVSSTSTTAAAKELEFVANTFYFKTLAPVSGELKVRISSTNLNEVTELLPLLDAEGNLVITLDNDNAETTALKFLKGIYSISQPTEVLGALVYPFAVQMSSFKESEEEVKEVIDILAVPPGLLIATGTAAHVKTDYYNHPRSVIIPITKLKVTSATANKKNHIGADLLGEAGVIGNSQVGLSKLLQDTFDSVNDFRNSW